MWRAWLPTYRNVLGLAWAREDQAEQAVGDRQFRRRLLSTRPGTSIDASTDVADDGSLRETECIEMRWRNECGRDTGRVAMVGYVFVEIGGERKAKYARAKRRLDDVNTLFIGGDTRYGLGRIRRVAFDRIDPPIVFGSRAFFDVTKPPSIVSDTVRGHADAAPALAGALELLGGWDHRNQVRIPDRSLPVWVPGSKAPSPVEWSIEADGVWKAA